MSKKTGFTLLEVIFAIAILAVSAIIFSRQQIKSALSVLKGREIIDRLFIIKKEFNSNFFSPPKQNKKNIKEEENLNLKITTQTLHVEKKSSLKKFENDINFVLTKGEWKTSLGTSNIKILGIVLKTDYEV